MASMDDYTTITGTLQRASDSHPFQFKDRKGITDYFHLELMTDDFRLIQVSLNIKNMGWSGAFQKSKIWYWNPNRKRAIKTSMTNPSRYIGKKFQITGHLQAINKEDKIYKMFNVQRVILFP